MAANAAATRQVCCSMSNGRFLLFLQLLAMRSTTLFAPQPQHCYTHRGPLSRTHYSPCQRPQYESSNGSCSSLAMWMRLRRRQAAGDSDSTITAGDLLAPGATATASSGSASSSKDETSCDGEDICCRRRRTKRRIDDDEDAFCHRLRWHRRRW